MHIVICNERFLFRFGVDRVLLILTRLLRQKGHYITLMGVTMDNDTALSIADKVVHVPSGDDYYNINEYVQGWLERNWDKEFSDNPPDVVLSCGWPFFTSMPLFKDKVRNIVFHDYGIVPIYNYSEGTLKIQEKVRDLRKKYLKYSSYVITISDYITKTTYEIQPEYGIPVQTIHLGIDHMKFDLWSGKNSERSQKRTLLKRIEQFRARGNKIILNLGRWEPGHYKNSEAMYQVMRKLLAEKISCVMLVLGTNDTVHVPNDLKDNLIPLGYVDDMELVETMENCDLGISSSLWEGFNLPMPEMQYYDRPVLAFRVGAHPEVALHPWYLCNSVREMVYKAKKIFAGQDLPREVKENARKRFREYFTWERCAALMEDVIQKVVAGGKYGILPNKSYVQNGIKTIDIIMEMSNPANDPANPGIIRICRRLAAQLQYYINPIFVIWDDRDKTFVLPTAQEFGVMSQYGGPIMLDKDMVSSTERRTTLDEYYSTHMRSKFSWMLLPDIIRMDKRPDIQRYCLQRDFKIAEIFYDDIPWRLTEMYDESERDTHAQYMICTSDSDLVMSISEYSSGCLREFLGELGLNYDNLHTIEIPGELSSTPRVLNRTTSVGSAIQFVYISTLEPRKNHRQVIEACLMLEKKAPDLDFKFIMIGNRFAGHFDIADYAVEISRTHEKIQWIGVVDDTKLSEIVQESAFTVYASRMEGYGMPIMESLWQGKPCLCSKDGVMGELAAGGGCYTVDVDSPLEICDALYRLCTDSVLRERLTDEAMGRKIKTWFDYGEEVLEKLFLTASSIDGEPLPDRKYGDALFSTHSIPDVIPDELCRFFSSTQFRQNHITMTFGIAEATILKFLAEHYDTIFSFNNGEHIASPDRKVISICGDPSYYLNEIAAGIHDYGIVVGAVFLRHSTYQESELGRLLDACGINASIISYVDF